MSKTNDLKMISNLVARRKTWHCQVPTVLCTNMKFVKLLFPLQCNKLALYCHLKYV